MIYSIAAILAGIGILVWSADRFVTGASSLARNLGVSPLLVGLTIVGIGTSAPEILVSALASLQGNPGLAIGNALGSNIANIGLILGMTAVISPLVVRSSILRRELPIVLGVSIGAALLFADQAFDHTDGIILIIAMVLTSYLLFKLSTTKLPGDELAEDYSADIPSSLSNLAATSWTLIGLLLLVAGSRLLVWGAVNVAQAFGVSDLVIGLTIVAVGTSLPELATSLTAARKGEEDLAVGNVLGSNLYNLLIVLPMAGLLAPGDTAPELMSRDLPVMLGFTIVLFVMARQRNHHGGRIGRFDGILLLAAFIMYEYWLYSASMGT